MKKIAILVIAALNQPVYIHYIRTHWARVIEHTNKETPNIDVFLLLENGTVTDLFADILGNVIEDQNVNYDHLCEPRFQAIGGGVPSILVKTIYALELLHEKYDVFFRTNLSSFIKISAFQEYVNAKESIVYSGAMVWHDALRESLLFHNRVGPGKNIESLDELSHYQGNTFCSGAGYFLNSEEARSLIERKERLRYDLADDVAVGLMFDQYEFLANFTTIVEPETSIEEMVGQIKTGSAPHVRLQHFPLEVARAVWQELEGDPIWK